MKRISSLLLLALISGAMTLGGYKLFFEPGEVLVDTRKNSTPFITTSLPSPAISGEDVDFIEAAENTVHAVVHVKNVTETRVPGSIFDFYYGSGGTPRTQVGTGSGVIISPDGYIVTNNHVIANASRLQITLNNNKSFEATLIGADAETDIALLKVETEEELPYLAFGDSDQIRLGEWVLAVGNPFNLTSTVTAGIISAKARDLDERDNRFQAFIQTDAAVNPGNSGGALVNTRGELVGINTAITSQTGSYVGYSFAVPSNIARKVVEDIMEYGNVQIGNIGIRGTDLKNVRDDYGIEESEGVYVAKVIEDSGADKAGLKTGDIIKSVDNIKISKFSDLTGYLRSKRPNDQVSLSILRNSNELTVPVTLLKNTTYDISNLGLSVQELSAADKKDFRNAEGVKITNSSPYWEEFKLQGKILIAINDMKTESIEDVKDAMSNLNKYRTLSILVSNEDGERERIYIKD